MINIVFFGTPKIALKSLEYLYNSDKINVLAVVTQPDKQAGRGHKITMSPIKEFALAKELPVFQPKSIRKSEETIEALKALKPDFFVTFAFFLKKFWIFRNTRQLTYTHHYCRNTAVQTLFSVQ